jgi:predicted RNA-binding Zn-ribbon protein involved in translation (DUF1610 family)
MKNYKFKLDKSSKKYLCPRCGKKSLVRYVDSFTGELESEQYGKCDREVKCGFILYPNTKWVGSSNLIKSLAIRRESQLLVNKKQVYIPREAFNTTLGGYNDCAFFAYLSKRGVPDNLLEEIISMYLLGTIQSGYLRGALTIPYINEDDQIAFVQVKQFDEQNRTIKTSALHSLLKYKPGNQWIEDYEKNELKVSCFFGAHLLKKYPKNPIALVEAPKTAIYGSCYFGLPMDEKGLLWLAVYNKSSLTEDKFKVLKGRKIMVFPDLSANGGTYNEWKKKVEQFANKLPKTKVVVNDFLELYASNELRQAGGDFADYLSQFTWQEYQNGGKSVESVENDTEKKHFLENVPIDKTDEELENLLQPHTGYSMKEIVNMLAPFDFFHKLNDLEAMDYLLCKEVIKQDCDRDNYYGFDSTPF